MDKVKLLILFGESSAGKDTIQRWLVSNLPNAHGIVSTTSRPPREYEKEGIDYHFVSTSDFKKLVTNNEMLEYTYFNSWYYGTTKNELKKIKLILEFLILLELKIY